MSVDSTDKGLLTPDNCAVIFIDHQPQMFFGVANIDRQDLLNNVLVLAKGAKQKRRRLERRWKRTGDEVDRQAYRGQCRIANGLINESRRQYYKERIADITSGAKKRWSAVNELLHTSQHSFISESEARTRCDTISSYFAQKNKTNEGRCRQ